MAKKLTIKQRKFIKRFLETGNASQSGLDAGYKNYASGCNMLENVRIKAAIEKLMEKKGLTDELLLNKHLQLLNAKKIQSCTLLVKREADGKYQINQSSDDFIEVDDNNVQLGALRLAYEVTKRLSNQPIVDQSQHTHLVIVKERIDDREGSSLQPDQATNLSIQPTHE